VENMEPAEARECTFSPEIHELTVLCVRHVVMTELEESSNLQFPFELPSPSFSDAPGLQDNIFLFTVTAGDTSSL
jgi:hypothetical protein